jgi:DMSO/TMAO reductase YedYZ heme-binding membrane subunit
LNPPLATAGAPALWYLSRGSGAVSLILLSTALVLGVVDQRRWRSERWPRFTLHGLHRWVSLFAVSFLSVHILSAVLDSFAPIRLLDAVIPFAGSYRPLWLGFGTLAFDMLLAVTITSLLKKRIGQRSWRAVHWLSYAAWPVALVHGLGTGSDVHGGWLLAVTIVCVAAVWIAVLVRVIGVAPRARLASLGALAALPIAAVVWLPQGPLAKGWARRAGTPARLLAVSDVTRPAPVRDLFPVPFSAYLGGSETDSTADSGAARVDLAMRLAGGANGAADVVLEGPRLAGGGLSVQTSRVTLGPASDPERYRGRVVSLDGSDLVAELNDRAGNPLRADFRLVLERGRVQGSVSVTQE